MRTYLIEPQSVFVPYLRRVLAGAGFDVIAIGHSVDARDIALHQPAAIVVDVDYVERTGPTALCRIREIAGTAQIIALSESSDATFVASCFVSGADAVCSKGDDEAQLLAALRRSVATA